jgi:hypothetical protein
LAVVVEVVAEELLWDIAEASFKGECTAEPPTGVQVEEGLDLKVGKVSVGLPKWEADVYTASEAELEWAPSGHARR